MRHIASMISLIAALGIAPTPANAADVATANALFNKGLAEMQAGRFQAACPSIRESFRLDPHPGVLFTLADCEANAGRIATAVALFDDYLALFNQLPADQQQKQRGRDQTAKKRKAILAVDVPSVTLILPADTPKGTRVLRDDIELGPATLGIALPIDPGEHIVAIETPDQPRTEQRFIIKLRDNVTIKLEVKRTAPGPTPEQQALDKQALDKQALDKQALDKQALDKQALDKNAPDKPPTQPPHSWFTLNPGTAVLAGLGGVALVGGSITGILVFTKKGTVDDNCKGSACNIDGMSAVSSAKTLGLISTISFVVAGASAAGITALLLTGRKTDTTKSESQRWLTVDLAANSAGGQVVFQGVW